MEEQSRFVSVGVDIGTTTTQLVFSSLLVRNAAGPTEAPRYVIAERDTIYRSPVVFTPKRQKSGGAEDIDRGALKRLIRSWYAEAGLELKDVRSGAVIITGESLKAGNAEETVHGLSELLGDCVAATAGPHLESIIAGKGAGAASRSENNRTTILNIDIGGGTSNYAVFRMGETVDSACLTVGGRLVECDGNGAVLRVHAPARLIMEEQFGSADHIPTPEQIEMVAARMADLIVEACTGMSGPLGRKLLQTPPLQSGRRYDEIMLSGGVAACIGQPDVAPYAYGDIGPLLARALLRHPAFAGKPPVAAQSAVRATVVGAGAWSMSLSGSTVWAEPGCLPLRNVPVVPVPLKAGDFPEDLPRLLAERLRFADLDPASAQWVFAFGDLPVSYETVRFLREGLAAFWKQLPESGRPVLIMLRNDMGRVLGMELRPELGTRPLIIADEVRAGEGDFVDFGAVQEKAGFIPLTIKSLAFSGGGADTITL